jgi:ABC-type antimicrobial peptide transport system permease subunit
MYYLHNTDLGFAFKNRGSMSLLSAECNKNEMKVLNDKIKQIPEIEEIVPNNYSLLPRHGRSLTEIQNWDNKPENIESLDVESVIISEEYVKFYELELVEGEFLNETDGQMYALINESAAKVFGWNKATGRTFDGYTVKGVIKNIYNLSPTIAAKPVVYKLLEPDYYIADIQFKYTEGRWKICVEKIRKIIAEEFSHLSFVFFNAEEEYDKYLKSENILLTILTVVSLVCMTVCVFGFVSIVSLTCEERRKEIAIRKINGATIKDILDIFFKEHLTLLAVGVLIAFPSGYIIMKSWLEQYVIQTEMSTWVYLSILLALMMVIVICVGGRVYKTSSENPVNALNK